MDPRELELVSSQTGPVLVFVVPGSLAWYAGKGYHKVYGGRVTVAPSVPLGAPAPAPPPHPYPPFGEWVHITLLVPKIHQSKRLQIRYVEIRFSATESTGAAIRELELWDGSASIFKEN
ncbi:hypothetical protein HAV15_010606 [Penicillium sp. str. |nr:hypothetical protein HAV15_010606 [Penicillium sp. str. \